MSAKQIKPNLAYYIKLGRNGVWEKECIETSQTLRLGYREAPHDLCLAGKWREVHKKMLIKRDDVGTATHDTNQIRMFYEADENVLWTTFFGDRLFWCFSKPEVTLLPDGSKSRPVIGRWSSSDIFGKPLQKNRLSGALLRMQGYRGTICKVKEFEYLVQKINGIVQPEVEEAEQAKAEFEKKIETLIRRLTWKDFELLIDLLFREAGWQRMAPVGKTEKLIDIDLHSPISGERFLVQVKASANLAKLKKFITGLGEYEDYSRAYFIVHTPSDDLINERSEEVDVWLPNEIARRVVMYGLADWVINKAR